MRPGWWRRRARALGWLGLGRRQAFDHRQLLDRHPGLLHEAVSALTAPDRLSGEELAALETSVRDRLAEKDYAALRDYGGRTAFRTFLYVVVQRILADSREERRKRWWQSVEESGHAGVVDRLQQLVCDEALGFVEALDEAAGGGDPARRAEVEALWASRPSSGPREVADLKWLLLAESSELVREPTPLERQLSAALWRVSPEERLILQMHFHGKVSLEAIAAWQQRPVDEQSRLLTELLSGIRDDLARAGVEAADVGALLSDPRPGYVRNVSAAAPGRRSPAPEGENGGSRPSKPVDMPDDPSNGD